jgi:hypothetical protein
VHLGPAAHLASIQIKPAPPLGGSVHPMRRDWLFAISLGSLVLLGDRVPVSADDVLRRSHLARVRRRGFADLRGTAPACFLYKN